MKHKKISVIPPGVNKNIFKSPKTAIERPCIVISAARMTKIKDLSFLLRVFKRVLTTNQDMGSSLFIVVGGNREEREKAGLYDLIKKINIEDFVSFVDGVPQKVLAKYFQISKVFVGTSKHETFGRIPVEARACGTPFVVRANSSYLSTAKNGEGGYFTNNYSEEEMAEKIGEILTMPFDKWQELSHLAVKSVEKFSWKTTAKKYLSLYKNYI